MNCIMDDDDRKFIYAIIVVIMYIYCFCKFYGICENLSEIKLEVVEIRKELCRH